MTPNTPLPAPVRAVVTFEGMERATVHLERTYRRILHPRDQGGVSRAFCLGSRCIVL